MEVKNSEKYPKKSYYLPEELTEYFSEVSKPGKDYSPKVAAGILLWLCLDDKTRKQAEIFAHSKNIKKAVAEFSVLLRRLIVQDMISEGLSGLSKGELAHVLAGTKSLEELIAHKK